MDCEAIKCKPLISKIFHSHDSCAVAAFRERSIDYMKDKGMLATQVIEWCNTLKKYKLAQAFLHLGEMVQGIKLYGESIWFFHIFEHILYVTHCIMSIT